MKTSLSMLFAGLLLVGCSADEEIATISNSASNAIGFNVVSNNPQTKATMINSTDDLKRHKLEVFAFKDGAYYMGSNADEESWKDHGVELKYDVATHRWTYNDSEPIYYWPHQEPLDFYAISPADKITVSFGPVSIKPETKQFSCFLTEDTKDYHVDAMYAMKLGVKKDATPNGTVHLTFKHALSQIVFQARKNDKSQSVTVVINGMQLYNVKSSGVFTFPTSDQNKGVWTLYDDLKSYHNIELVSESIDVKSGNEVTNLSVGNPLLCIPQTLTAWDHSSSNQIGDQTTDNAITDTNKTSFLRIKCKIHDGDHYFVGDADTWGYTYVPFGAIWEEGKRYIYTLYFGAGYNADGSEIDIVPITFDAEVTDWVNEDRDITDF